MEINLRVLLQFACMRLFLVHFDNYCCFCVCEGCFPRATCSGTFGADWVLLALIGWARGAMWSLEQPVNSVLCEHPAFQYLLQFYKDTSSVPGMACAGLHRGTVSLGNLGAESVKRVWIYYA